MTQLFLVWKVFQVLFCFAVFFLFSNFVLFMMKLGKKWEWVIPRWTPLIVGLWDILSSIRICPKVNQLNSKAVGVLPWSYPLPCLFYPFIIIDKAWPQFYDPLIRRRERFCSSSFLPWEWFVVVQLVDTLSIEDGFLL